MVIVMVIMNVMRIEVIMNDEKIGVTKNPSANYKIRSSKKYYNPFVLTTRGNLWKGINNLLSKNKNETQTTKVMVDNTEISDPVDGSNL